MSTRETVSNANKPKHVTFLFGDGCVLIFPDVLALDLLDYGYVYIKRERDEFFGRMHYMHPIQMVVVR